MLREWALMAQANHCPNLACAAEVSRAQSGNVALAHAPTMKGGVTLFDGLAISTVHKEAAPMQTPGDIIRQLTDRRHLLVDAHQFGIPTL